MAFKALVVISNWWVYFGDYLGLKRGEVTYKIKGKSITVTANSNDKKIITELVLSEPYFPKWLKLRHPTIIDLGAHKGIFSILATTKFQNSKIYAIEPSSKNFALLKRNIGVNNSRVIPFNIALSEKGGEMKLFDSENSARLSLVRDASKGFETVETQTLEGFFKEQKINKCDLLKIDIEGGEYQVLLTAPKKIFDRIDNIFMETHKMEGYREEDLVKFLKDRGYKINPKWREESMVYARK